VCVCAEFGDVEMISNYTTRLVDVRPDVLCHFQREQCCSPVTGIYP